MTTSHWPQALVATIALTLTAFLAAWAVQDSGWLSHVPPATDANPNPAPDVTDANQLALYQSAFTAWAALILLIPAYIFVWTRRHGPAQRQRWLAWWTFAWVAYIIHLGVSMVLFFQGDFAWMTSSSRVSAFWPGMLIAVWWPIDCLLARLRDTGWVTAQRVLIHILVFVLFVGGSAVKGEMAIIQALGWVFLALTLVTGGLVLFNRSS